MRIRRKVNKLRISSRFIWGVALIKSDRLGFLHVLLEMVDLEMVVRTTMRELEMVTAKIQKKWPRLIKNQINKIKTFLMQNSYIEETLMTMISCSLP